MYVARLGDIMYISCSKLFSIYQIKQPFANPRVNKHLATLRSFYVRRLEMNQSAKNLWSKDENQPFPFCAHSVGRIPIFFLFYVLGYNDP